jgi:hypothetical protein
MRQYEDLLIDVLLDHGFTVAEAERLIRLQERVEAERKTELRVGWLRDWPEQARPERARDVYN